MSSASLNGGVMMYNTQEPITKSTKDANGVRYQKSYGVPWSAPSTKLREEGAAPLALLADAKPRCEKWDGVGSSFHMSHVHSGATVPAVLPPLDLATCLMHATCIPTSVLFFSYASGQNLILAGNKNGKIYMWDVTEESAIENFKVAGRVASFDSWNGYIAVGSSIVQLINVNDTSTRVLYLKEKEHSSRELQYLVSFMGGYGDLISAAIGGNTLELWPPPQEDMSVMLKPTFTATLGDGKESIVSLSASKFNKFIAVVSVSTLPGIIISNCLLRILDDKLRPLYDSEPVCLGEIQENDDIVSVYMHFLRKGRCLAISKGNVLKVLEGIGDTIHTRSTVKLEHEISCLSLIDHGSVDDKYQDLIVVGTTSGEIKIFSDDLETLTTVLHTHGILSVAAEYSGNTKIYAIDNKGAFQVWNEQSEPLKESYLIGKQLCSEGIFTKRQIIPLTEQNLSFNDDGVHLKFPSEAIDQNLSLEVAVGLCGPYIFPKNMLPVSPFVWLCTHPQKCFSQPVEITLPHCVDCKNSDTSQNLCVLKAEHKDITIDKNGHLSINMKKSSIELELPPRSHCGTLLDNHFCIYCLAECVDQKQLMSSGVEYCLTILKPNRYHISKTNKIYCLFHYNLPTCKRLVREQKPQHYDEAVLELKFSSTRYESAIEIDLGKQDAERNGWLVTVASDTKILAENVNHFNYRNIGKLTESCTTNFQLDGPYPYTYPPRFVLEVSPTDSCKDSKLGLSFIGGTKPVHTEVQLITQKEKYYKLTLLKPKEYLKDKTCKIYCILHCSSTKLIVSDTLLQEYAAVVPFQMRLPKAAVVAIQVDKARAEDHGWTVSLESNTKVHIEEIDQNAEQLYAERICQPTEPYPGKFVLEVSSREASRSSVITLAFTPTGPGVEMDSHTHQTEIQLHYSVIRTDLQGLINFGNGIDTASQSSASVLKPFTTQNGLVQPEV